MRRYFVLFCLAIPFLTSCSRLDIAFHWADTFIASKVDDYFDISSGQSKALKKSLQQDFAKIKAQVLPQWIEGARQLENDVATENIRKDHIAPLFGMVMSQVQRFTAYFADTAVDFISTTDSKQLAYFSKVFHEKMYEDLKLVHNPQKQHKEYQEKYYKYFGMFLGSLTREQKNLIERHIVESPFPSELKMKNKEWIFQQFQKESTSQEKIRDFVRDLSNHPEKYDLPEYQDAFKRYQEHLQNLVIQVLQTLTPEQKKELRDNLLEKVAQLQKIRDRS